jgi:hypothetical protein
MWIECLTASLLFIDGVHMHIILVDFHALGSLQRTVPFASEARCRTL